MNGLLLDTHAWIWYAEGLADRLTSNTIDQFEAARRRGALQVSAVSVWEIAMLQTKNRLHLAAPLRNWIDRALAVPGLRLVPIDAPIALESALLPGNIHGDPADRFLAATARIGNLRLATADAKLIEYGEQGFVSILAL